MSVDAELLRQVHRNVGDRLQREQLARRRQDRAELVGPAKEQYARKLIADVLLEHAERLMALGQSPLEHDVRCCSTMTRLRTSTSTRAMRCG